MTSNVFLNNLDDFIAPSQSCVNPFVSSKRDEEKPKVNRKHGRITIEADFGGNEMDEATQEPDLIKHRVSQDKKIATVSLNDCLACSGCVTSAEAVLIQEQSLDKFLNVLSSYTSTEDDVVVQLSPNSVSSIADFLGWTASDFFLRIATVLKKMGVKYVLDSSAGGDVAIIETREEVIMRYGKVYGVWCMVYGVRCCVVYLVNSGWCMMHIAWCVV
ncbi:hypothetical protein EON65_41745 [archaeon]|nr:MAG: hypothetical protein EON65_41745 [archaeon]